MNRPSRWALRASAAVVAAALLVAGADPARGDDGVLCLGPGVQQVIVGLLQAHAFDRVVAPGYRLERLDVQRDHIELGYDDAAGPAATVVLGPSAEAGDARGPHFAHHLVEVHGHAMAADRAAMLAAAMLVDAAIPASEVRRCGGPATSGDDGSSSSMPPRAPRIFGVGVGLAEAAILVAAVALGLRGSRRGRRRPG